MDRNEKSRRLLVFKEQHHKFSPKLWTESYMNQDTSNKALHLSIDDETTEPKTKRKEKIRSRWAELPDLLLEQVFQYLTIRERYYASLVCKKWNNAFYLSYVWSEFVLEDSTLTRARFNYYQGWQYVLDHLRTQMCLTQVGRNFRKLTFEPMLNFFNLYEFMNMVSWYCEQSTTSMYSAQIGAAGVGRNIRTLKFTFPCNMNNRDENERAKLFGTGGRLLGALKRLMFNLKQLKRLELIDLMLDAKEAQFLLDDVCDFCLLTLHTLVLINTTTIQYQLLHVTVFMNLEVLIISPQNLGDDVVELLGYTRLKHLHIYQNRYTPSENIVVAISGKSWKTCRQNNPNLCVHLEMEAIKEKEIIWQENAPTKSIIYDTPFQGIQLPIIVLIIEMYAQDLKVFGHKSLPRGYRSKSFHERIDEPLMLLCRSCINIQTLVISERISTCTILLIVTCGKRLKNLFVRRNAVLKKCDWNYSNRNWSTEFYSWLRMNCFSYENVEREVSQILGRQWKMLSDKAFKKLQINLHNIS